MYRPAFSMFSLCPAGRRALGIHRQIIVVGAANRDYVGAALSPRGTTIPAAYSEDIQRGQLDQLCCESPLAARSRSDLSLGAFNESLDSTSGSRGCISSAFHPRVSPVRIVSASL